MYIMCIVYANIILNINLNILAIDNYLLYIHYSKTILSTNMKAVLKFSTTKGRKIRDERLHLFETMESDLKRRILNMPTPEATAEIIKYNTQMKQISEKYFWEDYPRAKEEIEKSEYLKNINFNRINYAVRIFDSEYSEFEVNKFLTQREEYLQGTVLGTLIFNGLAFHACMFLSPKFIYLALFNICAAYIYAKKYLDGLPESEKYTSIEAIVKYYNKDTTIRPNEIPMEIS